MADRAILVGGGVDRVQTPEARHPNQQNQREGGPKAPQLNRLAALPQEAEGQRGDGCCHGQKGQISQEAQPSGVPPKKLAQRMYRLRQNLKSFLEKEDRPYENCGQLRSV